MRRPPPPHYDDWLRLCITATALLALLLQLEYVTGLQQVKPSSLITNTQWKLRLDIGLQPGTWMPKRYPGWAESGGRLGFDVVVEFTDTPHTNSGADADAFIGRREDTFDLHVVPSHRSTFVSERGEETVSFAPTGGWCVQRPNGDVRNARGGFVKPEGVLRFWLDCPSGAKRRDVEIFPNTRVFGTTGVWDDPAAVRAQDEEYRAVLKELGVLTEKTKALKEERNEEKNVFRNLWSFQKLVEDSRRFDVLKARKEQFERELPPLKASTSSNGVQIAPSGSLVIKGNSTPDWLPGSEYLILGTFSVTAIDG